MDKLLTTAEVADLTRSPEGTVRYWRSLRIGPPSFRLGRRVVYRENDVISWINTQAANDAAGPRVPAA